jgi:hypothetical protein
VPGVSLLSPSGSRRLTAAGALAALGLYAAALAAPAADLFVPLSGWDALRFTPSLLYDQLTGAAPGADPRALLQWTRATALALVMLTPNPLLGLGLLALFARRPRLAWVAGGLALLAALAAALGWCHAEGGRLLAGAYLWLASMAVVAAAGLWADLGARPAAAGPVAPHGG